MKQFRFIGDPDNWAWEPKLVVGKVYPSGYSGFQFDGKPITVEQASSPSFCTKGFEDWEEVGNER